MRSEPERGGSGAGSLRAAGEDDAWSCALRLLARRPHSRAEVYRKLSRRGYAPVIIRRALDRLAASGYLDDAAFAAEWTRAVLTRRPVGRCYLIHELVERGVDRALATRVVDQILMERGRGDDQDPDLPAARSAVVQRLKAKLQDPASVGQRERRRLIAFLQRRGFHLSTIRIALREAGLDPAMLDTSERETLEF